MKRVMTFVLAMLVCSLTLFAQAMQEKPADDQILIGISKIITHPALDAIEKGARDYLEEAGINAVYDVQSILRPNLGQEELKRYE